MNSLTCRGYISCIETYKGMVEIWGKQAKMDIVNCIMQASAILCEENKYLEEKMTYHK